MTHQSEGPVSGNSLGFHVHALVTTDADWQRIMWKDGWNAIPRATAVVVDELATLVLAFVDRNEMLWDPPLEFSFAIDIFRDGVGLNHIEDIAFYSKANESSSKIFQTVSINFDPQSVELNKKIRFEIGVSEETNKIAIPLSIEVEVVRRQ